jgi:hypothetical protein
MLWMLTGATWAATPYFGVEWRPLSRQDLVFVEEGRTSGTAVGAHDGTIRPVVSAFGGAWFGRWVAVQVGAGLAQLVTTSLAEEVYVQRHLGVFRPSFDLRFGWMEQRLHRPTPWFLLGGWVDVPTSRDVSNAYTTEEQEAADLAAAEDRYRLSGGGARAGFGVDYRLLPGLMLGAQVAVGLQRTSFPGDADATSTLWVTTEAALLLTFEWPGQRNPARHPAADGPGGAETAENVEEPTSRPGAGRRRGF